MFIAKQIAVALHFAVRTSPPSQPQFYRLFVALASSDESRGVKVSEGHFVYAVDCTRCERSDESISHHPSLPSLPWSAIVAGDRPAELGCGSYLLPRPEGAFGIRTGPLDGYSSARSGDIHLGWSLAVPSGRPA